MTPLFRSASKAARHRHGLSLLEVLISMFVLLFGLLGVACLFPLGQYNVARATRYDRAAALGQEAFNDIKVRGLLQPGLFTVPAQIDSFATMPVTGMNLTVLPGLTRDNTNFSASAAWHVFVARDDLSLFAPTNRDQPAAQLYKMDMGNPVQRQYQGDYSWMFTVVPSDTQSEYWIVSVAVFQKRAVANEFTIAASGAMHGRENGGRFAFVANAAQRNFIKAGDWVLVSRTTGVNSTPPYFRWHQIETFVPSTTVNSRVQLKGPGWDYAAWITATQFNLSFFDSVVAVYEKLIPAESQTQWSSGP